ncbi:MAG: hypothetical protein ACIAQU_04175 [Phycisphaerales bacterium JB064]
MLEQTQRLTADDIQSNILSAPCAALDDKWTYTLAMAVPCLSPGRTWVFACNPHYIVASAEPAGEPEAEPYFIDQDGKPADGRFPDVMRKVGEVLHQHREWVTVNWSALQRLVDAMRAKGSIEDAYVHIGIAGPDEPIAVMVRGREAYAVLAACHSLEHIDAGPLFYARASGSVVPLAPEPSDA